MPAAGCGGMCAALRPRVPRRSEWMPCSRHRGGQYNGYVVTLLRHVTVSLLLLAPLWAPVFAADPPAHPDRLLARLPGSSGMAVEFSRADIAAGDGPDPARGPCRGHVRGPCRRAAHRRQRRAAVGGARGRQLGQPLTVPRGPANRRGVPPCGGVGVRDVAGGAVAGGRQSHAQGRRTQVVLRPDGPAHWDVEVWDVTPRKQLTSLAPRSAPGVRAVQPGRPTPADGRAVRPGPARRRRGVPPVGPGRRAEAWPALRTDYNYAVPSFAPAAFSPDGTVLAIGSRWSFAL